MRRNKSIELREDLDRRAEMYFNNTCSLKDINLNDKRAYFAVLSLKCIPLFPPIGHPIVTTQSCSVNWTLVLGE